MGSLSINWGLIIVLGLALGLIGTVDCRNGCDRPRDAQMLEVS